MARKLGQQLDLAPKHTKIPQPDSELEAMLDMLIRVNLWPVPKKQYHFHPSRSFRFDHAWPDRMLAVECEGITHEGGRHQRVKGYTEDCHKYNLATLMGWRVLRFTKGMLTDGSARDYLREALENENDSPASARGARAPEDL
jgi:very-short-patch-repair endonuclease